MREARVQASLHPQRHDAVRDKIEAMWKYNRSGTERF
jgi:hypothetical protein